MTTGSHVVHTQATAFAWVGQSWETAERCGKATSTAQRSPEGECVAVHSVMLPVGRHCRCTAVTAEIKLCENAEMELTHPEASHAFSLPNRARVPQFSRWSR